MDLSIEQQRYETFNYLIFGDGVRTVSRTKDGVRLWKFAYYETPLWSDSGPGLTILTNLEMTRSRAGRLVPLGADCSTNKSVDLNQTLADWIDGDKKAFYRDGAEKRWAVRGDEAGSGDFIGIKLEAGFCDRPSFMLTSGDDDALRARRFQAELLRHRLRHDA